MDPQSAPELPFVGLEHIGVGTLHLLGATTCAGVRGPALLAEPGEVLFGKLRPAFRKVVRVRTRLACTSEAWVLAPRQGVDPDYLLYLAADPAFVDACAAESTGTRMPRANWGFAAAWRLPLPPLPEQRRVAGLLGALDDKIELHRTMNHTLEELARTLFHAWFAAPEPGGLPPGWQVGRLAAVATEVRDTVDPGAVPGDTPCVGLEHLPRRSVALDRWGRADETTSSKRRFQPGDCLFGRLRPHFHKVAPAPVHGLASTDVLVLRPADEAWRWFLLGHLHSDALIAHATACADGTRMPRVTWRDLGRYRVALPPPDQAAEYGRLVEPLFARIACNVAEARCLAALRDALLPRLLAGTLRTT